jgi:hypothetical protein
METYSTLQPIARQWLTVSTLSLAEIAFQPVVNPGDGLSVRFDS